MAFVEPKLIRGFSLPRTYLPLGQLQGTPFYDTPFGRYEVMRKGRRLKYAYVCVIGTTNIQTLDAWIDGINDVMSELKHHHMTKGTYRGHHFQFEIDCKYVDKDGDIAIWSKKSEFYLNANHAQSIMLEKLEYVKIATEKYEMINVSTIIQTDVKFNALWK